MVGNNFSPITFHFVPSHTPITYIYMYEYKPYSQRVKESLGLESLVFDSEGSAFEHTSNMAG